MSSLLIKILKDFFFQNPPRPFEFVVQIDAELLDKWMNRATGGKTKSLRPTVKKLDHFLIEEVPNCA